MGYSLLRSTFNPLGDACDICTSQFYNTRGSVWTGIDTTPAQYCKKCPIIGASCPVCLRACHVLRRLVCVRDMCVWYDEKMTYDAYPLGVQGGGVVKAIEGWYAYLEVKDTSSNGVLSGPSSSGTSFNGTEQRRGDDDDVKEQMEVWRVYECPFGACGANNSCKGK